MSFINFAMKELVLLILYLGPPGAGKSTNIRWLKNRQPQRTYNPPMPITPSEEVDFLAPSLRAKHDFGVRLCLRVAQLEDLASADFDGIVLVLDGSEHGRREGQAFASQLQKILAQHEREDTPVAIQYNNKRSGASTPTEIFAPTWMRFESNVLQGVGVVEPLRELTKLLLARSK